MKKIALIIMVAVTMMACDKIVDSPQRDDSPEQQKMEASNLPETLAKDDSEDIAKGNSEAIDSGSVPVRPEASEGMADNN